MSGEGEAGINGGPAGDLYVQMHLKDHEIFVREDNDLHCEMPIPFTQAALGGNLKVPTLGGEVSLKIPAIVLRVVCALTTLLARVGVNTRLTQDKLNEIFPMSWTCESTANHEYKWPLDKIISETFKDYQQRKWL